jgi:hypothetical protein
VIRREGRDGLRSRDEVDSLEAALARAKELGTGTHGRTPLIYAVTADRMSIHIDERHLRMLEERDGGKSEHD